MTVGGPSSPEVPSYGDYPANPHEHSLVGGNRIQGADQPGAGRPPVSIVTIVRDRFTTLPRTVLSVLSQDFAGIEYVIIDGGSKDGTLDILRAHQDRIGLWVSETDRGISDAFNKGIALSRGEIIGLLNSDDWYEPGVIRDVVMEMQRTGAEIACGRLQYWDGDRRTYLVESDPTRLEGGMTLGHPTVFVRRDCYRKLGLFRLDFRLAMDYEWLLRAKSAGVRFLVVDRCLANMQGGGVGDRRWRNSQREVARARALHIPGADTWLAYDSYVYLSIAKGMIRRSVDKIGLGVVRRLYHRWLSPVSVTSNHDDRIP